MSRPMTFDDEDQARKRDLRDWFAGMAMQGILAGSKMEFPVDNELLAMRCYELADAMMETRDE